MRDLIARVLGEHRAEPIYVSRLDGHVWWCSCPADSESAGEPVYAYDVPAVLAAEAHVAEQVEIALTAAGVLAR